MDIARILVFGGLALGACVAPGQGNPSTALLADSYWFATGETSVGPRDAPRLHFLADGKLAGYTGCNRVVGAWRVEAGEIKLSELSSTKRGCLGPGAEVERRFTTALAGRVSIEGQTLVVSGGNERVEFIREGYRREF